MQQRYPRAKFLGQTPSNSGRFKQDPRFLVMHYTAGGGGRGSAEYLMKPTTKASAHFVVDRDGTVYQISELGIITWHAGESFWRGLKFLNSHSIGIEFANYGFLRQTQDPTRWLIAASDYRSVYNDKPDVYTDDVVIARHKNRNEVLGWEPYPQAQIDAGIALTKWILAQYPSIKEIVGHDDIAPSRKTDPGPAFPMHSFVNVLFPNSGGDVVEADEPTAETPLQVVPQPDKTQYIVATEMLNVRGGPGSNFDRLSWGPLREGKAVTVLQVKDGWSFIEYRGSLSTEQGWVASQYLKPA